MLAEVGFVLTTFNTPVAKLEDKFDADKVVNAPVFGVADPIVPGLAQSVVPCAPEICISH